MDQLCLCGLQVCIGLFDFPGMGQFLVFGPVTFLLYGAAFLDTMYEDHSGNKKKSVSGIGPPGHPPGWGYGEVDGLRFAPNRVRAGRSNGKHVIPGFQVVEVGGA